MFGRVLDEVTPDYNNKIDFYKVNVEEESSLAVMFNARSLPTVIMIDNDGKTNQGTGAMNKETLKYYLDGLISK